MHSGQPVGSVGGGIHLNNDSAAKLQEVLRNSHEVDVGIQYTLNIALGKSNQRRKRWKKCS